MKSQAANNRSQQGPSTTSWELARTLKEQAVPGSTKTHWQHWDAGKQLSLSGNFHQTLAHTLIKSKIRLSKHGPCKFTNTPKTMSSLNSRIQLSILNKKKEPDLVQKGFTLVELMVVIVIVGILSAIALPNFLNNTTKAKATEAKTKISAILKDAHAEYQLDGQIATAIAAAEEQAEDNDSDNFTFTANAGTADDQVTVTAVANPSADGGDATLVTAEADGTALDGCVNLTTGKIEIRKSFKDDTALDCSA